MSTPYSTPYSGILLKNRPAQPRVGMDKMLIGKPPGRQNQTGIPVTVAIFFDGTGNNRNNTAQRHMVQQNKQEEDGIQRTKSFEKYGRKKDEKTLTNSSYAAGYSNVSILERLNIKREIPNREISIYVEGIGTTDDKADDTPGSGFGKGKTGVKDKVTRGIMLLAEKIAKVLEKNINSYVNQLTIDVFGFSRGAAAARHFVAQLRDAKHPLPVRLGTPEAKITIKFVGIFDTVSSVGYGLGFGSNVKELGLDLGGVPKKVVHLTAGNEYRANFSLTDATSSLNAGVAYELTLPGVHSNIGGSYGEQEDEVRQLHLWEREALIAQGWYTKDEAPVHEDPIYNEYGMQIGTNKWAEGTRKDLNQDYQFIPLRIMAENAVKVSMDLEPLAGDYAKYAIAPTHPLAPVQAVILKQVGQHGAHGRHALVLAGEWSQIPPNADIKPLALTPGQAIMVRHCYLRRSASIGFQGLADGLDRIGMGERRDEKKRPHRNIFPG